MKRFLPVLFIGAMLLTGNAYAAAAPDAPTLKNPPSIEHRRKMKQNFEQRLKLTDEQKIKARKIHEKGFKQMKPVMQKIATLKQDIYATKKSNMDETSKDKKIQKDITEIRKLEQKADEIRHSNSKEFEKILTKDQQAELEKMKAEGRRNFDKIHRPRPPFNMFSPDCFNFKGFHPMLPPQPQEYQWH